MNTYKSTEYTLYDGEVPIFTGDCREVAEKFGITTSAVSSYRNNGTKLFGKYLILKTGEPQRKKKPQTLKKTKEELTLEYLSFHLKNDGNVSFSNKDEIKKIVVEQMQSAIELKVPLIAQISEATNWYECK